MTSQRAVPPTLVTAQGRSTRGRFPPVSPARSLPKGLALAGSALLALALALGLTVGHALVGPALRAGGPQTLASALAPIVTPAVRAADPSPSPAAVPTSPTLPGTGDARSSGQGPGFVGAPLLAIGGVLIVALVTTLLTVLYVRATGGRDEGGGAG